MSASPTNKHAPDDLPDTQDDPDSQELWEGWEWNSDDIAAHLAEAGPAPRDDAPTKTYAPGEVGDDAKENPFLDASRSTAKGKSLRAAVSDPGPSYICTALSRDPSNEEVPGVPNSSQIYYGVFEEYNHDDIAEADRVERDLIHEDYVEPEGPPSTQVISESSGNTSSRTSRTSFPSLDSLPGDCSEVKLGKRRARDSDEPIPERKAFKHSGPTIPHHLHTSKSDPGPHSVKKESLAAYQEPEPLGVAFIAHNSRVQKWFDELEISWGVQYELARGVHDCRWSWEGVTRDKLKQLQGSNADSVPRITAVMLPDRARVSSDNSIWKELDREQAAILENTSRGLGLQGSWNGRSNWYGGQVQQVVRLQWLPQLSKFKFTLSKMQMLRSHRFGRYLGSRRVIQIKVQDPASPETKKFLSQKLVLCGRIFRVFAVKDGTVYAAEVNEDYSRTPRNAEGDQFRCSLTELVGWYNPLHLNANQPVSKWATRFDLGLSNSIPVIEFAQELIYIIDDECAPHPPGSKVPTEKIYTDGCGFMNAAALRVIQTTLGLCSLPTAVQGRVFGSKGLWTLSPMPEHQSLGEDSGPPQIWIRKSQQKIKLVGNEDLARGSLEIYGVHKAHFVFDLVAVSRVHLNSHLSKHAIINLHHNGVPLTILGRLLEECVQREMKLISPPKSPHAMPILYHAIDRSRNVSLVRLKHYAAGAQRIVGLSGRWERDNDEDDTDADSLVAPAPVRCFPGGKPIMLEEGILRLLKAGFTLDEDILDQDLETLKNMMLKDMLDKMRLPLPSAAEAFLIPDPSGKLREGEIHFKSSKPFSNPLDEYNSQQVVGSCLIYRNPARLPSDVWKVRAVNVPELSMYTDVIVVPNDGPCSLPSILAGGDVDGDTAVCIWDQSVVEPFHNVPEITRVPEGFLEANFKAEDDIFTVAKLNEELGAAEDQNRCATLQGHMLTGLVQSKVGIYSKYHEAAIYMHGYSDPRTLRVAHMFNIILDSRKSGHILRPEVFQRDSRVYNVELPDYMSSDDISPFQMRPPNARRDKRLQPSVLKGLTEKAIEIRANFKLDWEKAHTLDFDHRRDADIAAAWAKVENCSYFRDEVAVVKEFVKTQFENWRQIWAAGTPSKVMASKAKTKEDKAASRAQLRMLCAAFNEGPPLHSTPRLRELELLDTALAAWAYSTKPKFGFQVAFTQLAGIKAKACGPAPTIEAFDCLMKLPASAIRVLGQRSDEP